MIIIEHQLLDPDTLENLIIELVTREGTDYGVAELPTETKKRQVYEALESGKANIVYDPETQSCALVAISADQ